MDKKDAIITFLAVALLLTVFSALGSIAASPEEYDPWVDVDDNGIINLQDLYKMAQLYGTTGPALTKASLLFDSGWIDITDKQGQFFDVVHNLEILDWSDPSIMVDMVGRKSLSDPILRPGPINYSISDRTYGGSLDDTAYSVVQTSDGGYALAGTTQSFGAGLTDAWLIKTDSVGRSLWSKTYGKAAQSEAANSVVQTSDGGYALGGYSGSDAWLVKTDSLGNAQWNKTYGGTLDEWFNSVIKTSDGGYALAGATKSFGSNLYDFYLVKTDSLGNMAWNKTYGGYHNDYARSVVQTSDGGYALAGYTMSFTGGWSYPDMWLVKTDGSGNEEWHQDYGKDGQFDDTAVFVAQTSDGGYAMAGLTKSYGAGNMDFWLVKTDSLGNAEWNKTYGGTNIDNCMSAVQTSDGGYALAGATYSFGVPNPELWLVKTDSLGNMEWSKIYGGVNDESARSIVQTSDGGYALAGYTKSFGLGGYDFFLVLLARSSEARVSCVGWNANTLTLYRNSADTDWNYLRIQVIKRK